MSDPIDRQSVINAVHECPAIHGSEGSWINQQEVFNKIASLPTVEPEDWMERNKERILQAGTEGREIEFWIGGRLFAIREKAQ